MRACGRNFGDQFAEDDIAHGETCGGQRNGPVAQLSDEVVVTASARKGAKFSRTIERFENDAGVIGEAAHNGEIDPGEASQAARFQAAHDLIELFALSTAIENGENRIG